MNTSEKDIILVISVIIIFLFFTYILPFIEKQFEKDNEELKEQMESLNNPENINRFDLKKCSKDCCLHNQWDVPHMKKNKLIEEGYVGSNLMCGNGSTGGCLCLKKKDLDYLEERGTNRKSCNI